VKHLSVLCLNLFSYTNIYQIKQTGILPITITYFRTI